MCLVLHFRFPDGFSEFSRQAGSSRLFGRKPFGESEIPWALLGKRRFLFRRRCSGLWEEVFCLRAFKSAGKNGCQGNGTQRRCLSGLQVLIKQLTGADQLADRW